MLPLCYVYTMIIQKRFFLFYCSTVSIRRLNKYKIIIIQWQFKPFWNYSYPVKVEHWLCKVIIEYCTNEYKIIVQGRLFSKSTTVKNVRVDNIKIDELVHTMYVHPYNILSSLTLKVGVASVGRRLSSYLTIHNPSKRNQLERFLRGSYVENNVRLDHIWSDSGSVVIIDHIS